MDAVSPSTLNVPSRKKRQEGYRSYHPKKENTP
jgi:hypothetical protein